MTHPALNRRVGFANLYLLRRAIHIHSETHQKAIRRKTNCRKNEHGAGGPFSFSLRLTSRAGFSMNRSVGRVIFSPRYRPNIIGLNI